LGAEPRNSFKVLLKRSEILPLPCKEKSSFSNFNVSKENFHKKKSGAHKVITRDMYHIHRPTADVSCFDVTLTVHRR